MISDFAARFDSFYSTRCDLRLYDECRGYRYEGDGYRVWEPQYETDLEPETVNWGPGAMMRGELDELYQDNDEPTLGYDETDEF